MLDYHKLKYLNKFKTQLIWYFILFCVSGNQQVISLEQNIKKKMEKEGLVGMAMAGGLVLAVGAIVGVGMAIAKAKW